MIKFKQLKTLCLFVFGLILKVDVFTQSAGYIQPSSRYDYHTHLINLKNNHIVDQYFLELDTLGIKNKGSDFLDSLLQYLCDSTKFEVNDYDLNIYYTGDSSSYAKYSSGLQNSILQMQKLYLKYSHKPQRLFAVIRINYLFVQKNRLSDGKEIKVTIKRECEGIEISEGLWEEVAKSKKGETKTDKPKKKKCKPKPKGWGKWGEKR